MSKIIKKQIRFPKNVQNIRKLLQNREVFQIALFSIFKTVMNLKR